MNVEVVIILSLFFGIIDVLCFVAGVCYGEWKHEKMMERLKINDSYHD